MIPLDTLHQKTYPNDDIVKSWPSVHVKDHSKAKPWHRIDWHLCNQDKNASDAKFEDQSVESTAEQATNKVLGRGLRWTFSKHRIVIAIDVKASLCAIGPGGLLLDSLLAITQKILNALCRSLILCDCEEDSVKISVVAQGSRISDMRVLAHNATLNEVSLPQICAQVTDVWAVMCREVSSGAWCDVGRAYNNSREHRRRANLQDLIINAKTVLDSLAPQSCPNMLIVTDGVVGMPDKHALRDMSALLRCSDISLGFVFTGQRAALTYGHVPDIPSLQALARATEYGFVWGIRSPVFDLEKLLFNSFLRRTTCMDTETYMRTDNGQAAYDARLSNLTRLDADSENRDTTPAAAKDTEIRYTVKGQHAAASKQLLRALNARLREGFQLILGRCDDQGHAIFAKLSLPFSGSLSLMCLLSIRQEQPGTFTLDVRFSKDGDTRGGASSIFPSLSSPTPQPRLNAAATAALVNLSRQYHAASSKSRSPARSPQLQLNLGFLGSPERSPQNSGMMSPRRVMLGTDGERKRHKQHQVLEDHLLHQELHEMSNWIKALLAMDRGRYALSVLPRSAPTMDTLLLRSCISAYFDVQNIDIVLLQPLRFALTRDSRSSGLSINACMSALTTWSKGALHPLPLPMQFAMTMSNAPQLGSAVMHTHAAFFTPLHSVQDYTEALAGQNKVAAEMEDGVCIVEVTCRQLVANIKVSTLNACPTSMARAIKSLEACISEVFFFSAPAITQLPRYSADDSVQVHAYMSLTDRSVWQQLAAEWNAGDTALYDHEGDHTHAYTNSHGEFEGDAGAGEPNAAHDAHGLALPLLTFLPVPSWKLKLDLHSSGHALFQLMVRMRCAQGFALAYGNSASSSLPSSYLEGAEESFTDLQHDGMAGSLQHADTFPPAPHMTAESAWATLVALVPLTRGDVDSVMVQYRLRLDRTPEHSILTVHMFMEPMTGEVDMPTTSSAACKTLAQAAGAASTQSLFARFANILQEQDTMLAEQISAFDAIYSCCRRRTKAVGHALGWQGIGMAGCGARLGHLLKAREANLQFLRSFAERVDDADAAMHEEQIATASYASSDSTMGACKQEASPHANAANVKHIVSQPIAIQPQRANNREGGGMQRVHSWSGNMSGLSASYDSASLLLLRPPMSPPELSPSLPEHTHGHAFPKSMNTEKLAATIPLQPPVVFRASKRMHVQV
jgi:hypothetical protein